MPDIVYLVEHPDARKFRADVRGTSRFEFTPAFIPRTLREDGFLLEQDLITHMLVDHRLPYSEFETLTDGFAKFQRTLKGPEKGFEDIYFGLNNPHDYRHRTNIHLIDDEGHLMIGSQLGYQKYERQERLTGIVKRYVSDRPYGIRPPFFAITDAPSFAELKVTFEQFGLEVRLVEKSASDPNHSSKSHSK